MKNLSLNKIVTAVASAQLAKLGANHGYQFNSDTVTLNAMFSVQNAAAHQRAWALQLWACPEVPKEAAALSVRGHLVASIALPPIGEIADETEGFSVTGVASTPAGRAENVMVLALVAARDGRFTDVQDFAVYSRSETFLQPRFASVAGYRIENDRIMLDVERIENPREAENISGTLSLELWATKDAYRGGNFERQPLSGVPFDGLSGQHEYARRYFDLPFVAPTAGSWNLVLMLREWTAAGFVTRDYVNFEQRYTVNAPQAAAEPVVKVEAQAKSAVKPAAARADGTVSINSATKAELVGIKGMPTKVAEGIVSKRPFKSLDDLAGVKGMGAKLLAKLRSKLKL